MLEAGRALVLRNGFSATSVSDILREAGCPKGCFYHHFGSKDGFGETLLMDAADRARTDLAGILSGEKLPDTNIRQRLMVYFSGWLEAQRTNPPGQGNLLVKVGAEISELSDSMRRVLVRAMERSLESLTEAFSLGVADGSLPGRGNPLRNAELVYNQMTGASLRALVCHDDSILDRALEAISILVCRQDRTDTPGVTE